MNPIRILNAAMAAVLVAAAPSAFALGTSTTESARLSASYSTWAGGKSNSDSLVAGLRSSSTINLKTTAADGTVSTATFTPTTKAMGYGNVKHALTLAQRSLANAGITNPTAAQMQAALMGGQVTLADGTTKTLTGVVALRAGGQGWGQIAKQYDTTLGGVTSGANSANSANSANTTTAFNSNAAGGARSMSTPMGPSGGGTQSSFGPGNSQSAPGIVNAPGGNLGAAPGNSTFGHSQGGGKGKGG